MFPCARRFHRRKSSDRRRDRGWRGDAAQRFLFRALGPSLSNRLTGVLQNPTLAVHGPNGELVGSNDNWGDASNAAEIQASGLAPGDSRESAVLISLAAGQLHRDRCAARTARPELPWPRSTNFQTRPNEMNRSHAGCHGAGSCS